MFGEKVKGYDVPVVNEREIRAAAGIMFVFACFAFANAWFVGNFTPIKITVVAFLIEFILRVINPKYAPSMILGKLFTGNQSVEYVGAPQKRFAWAMGLVLAIGMTVLVVIFNVKGPLNLGICLFCLVLLFFETAFSICIGCKMYNKFTKKQAKHCPGGVCELKLKHPIQNVNAMQYSVLGMFLLAVVLIVFFSLI